MNREQLAELFEQVRRGEVAVSEAVDRMRMEPIAELGFAKVDTHRGIRCGFPEVIYGAGKTPEQAAAIFDRLVQSGNGCLATRVTLDQVAAVRERYPNVDHEPIGRTLWHGAIAEPAGRVVVAAAGTSDLPVAKEAETTARVMGCNVELVVDVGVAGLHRLLSVHSRLVGADAIVVIAGMEGALASVVGGLVDCPVIAVPTSCGYGANFQGVAALLSMLSSCAANVAVVNIDGGFCGGYLAALIARRLGLSRNSPRQEPV